MQLKERRVNGVTVVDLSGRFTASDEPGFLKTHVMAAVDRGEMQIVLNLHDLMYVDSSCLGELVAAYTTATKRGGQIRLADPDRRLKMLLEITRLDAVFKSFETEAAAVGSFGSG